MIDGFDLIIFAVASLVVSVFAGFAGGGGGFITTPLMIFLGLSPAQAVSTNKIGGFAAAAGSLSGMWQANSRKLWKRALPIILLAFMIGAIAPIVIVNLDSEVYRRILGALILLMIPLLIYKKVGHVKQSTGKSRTYVGTVLLAIALWLQGVFSGGLGTLVNVVLMGVMGMSAIEANIIKRSSQLVLNVTIIVGILWAGLIVWPVALVSLATASVGGFIGGRIAVKKGDKFVMSAFLIAMFVSGIVLLVG